MEIFHSLDSFGFSTISIVLLAVIAVLLSSYVKLVTVLSIVRAGLGAYSLPSAFVTSGLALMLSLLVMYPTVEKSVSAINQQQVQEGEQKNFGPALSVWKDFLAKHAGEKEIVKFAEVAKKIEPQKSKSELSTEFRVLAPAFIVSELKSAFATGLNLFLPFLIIELLVAHLLVSLGTSQLSPSFVSLPFKLLLFVMIDGWTLITTNLIATYS